MSNKRKDLSGSDNSSDASGSDLDNDLLSLAKKKTKIEDTPLQEGHAMKSRSGGRKHSAPTSPASAASGSETSDSDDDWASGKKGKKKNKKKKKTSKSHTKQSKAASSAESGQDHSDPEEGEVSDSADSDAGKSVGSSDSDSDSEEFNDGYDENLMGDDDDQARLAQMTEREREEELFNRNERREAMRTRFEIEKKLRAARKNEQNRNKSKDRNKGDKDAFAPGDAKERSKERKKTVEDKGKTDKKAQAMNALKARREEKKEREEKERVKQEADRKKWEEEARERREKQREEREEKKAKKKLKASDVYSDDSGSSSEEEHRHETAEQETRHEKERKISSESEPESDEDRRAPKKVQFITTKEQLGKIRLSRYKLEKWVHAPFFKRVVSGCFVRIGIGMNSGKSIYRVAEIIDVCETGKVYQLGTTRTNKGLKLRHGAQERVFRLEFVSNQDFSDMEFAKWQSDCGVQDVAPPTLDELQGKLKDIQEALNHHYKEEEVALILQEKHKFRKSPYNYAVRKTHLMKDREIALARGDEEEAERLGREMAELEERADELDKARTSTLSSISYINERNRKRNVEQAELAILEEIRESGGMKSEDPFTRRSTKPGKHRMNNGKAGEVNGIPVVPAVGSKSQVSDEKKTTDTPLTVSTSSNADKPKVTEKSTLKSDLFSAHDFDIKIDLEMPCTTQTLPVTLKNSVALKDGPRRSLNLEDYKKKRGLI